MGTTMTLASLSAPRRASLILATGVAAAGLLLSTWLLIWLFRYQTTLTLATFWAGPADLSPASTALLYQVRDATLLNREATQSTPALVSSVESHLNQARGAPTLTYISAAGFFASNKGERGDVYLATQALLDGVIPDGEPASGQAEKLQSLIDVFKRTPGRIRGPRLLILDIGRIGTDRTLGIFGGDVVEALSGMVEPAPEPYSADYAEWNRKWGGFAVFCATAPGQWSHVSDGDRLSVFGHYMSEALGRNGAPTSIRDSHNLFLGVADKVARWAEDHRLPRQTPIVLGDVSLNMPLPQPTSQREFESLEKRKSVEMDRDDFVAKDLKTNFELERRLADASLDMLNPIAWREFREGLTRAERLNRAGWSDARNASIARVRRAERALTPLAGGGTLPSFVLNRVALEKASPRDAAGAARAALAPDTPPPAPNPPAEPDAEPKPAAPAKPPVAPGRSFENTLNDWARRYDSLLDALDSPEKKHESFVTLRRKEIDEAIRLRILAEEVGAAWEPHPWVEYFLDRGDEFRHKAEDALFDDEEAAGIRKDADAARAAYESARLCSEAVALAIRVSCDLPELGEWHVRHQARIGGDFTRLETIARAGADLHDLLERAADPRDVAPDLAELSRRVSALSRPFKALVADFEHACRSTGKTTRSAELNDLLATPGASPEERVSLSQAAIALADQEALKPPPEPTATPEPKEPSALADAANRAYRREFNPNAIVSHGLSQQGKQSTAGGWTIPSRLPEPGPDPSFERVAVGMGFLEWCVLTLGGATESAKLESLREACELEKDEKKLGKKDGKDEKDRKKLEEIEPLVRDLRARIGERLHARIPTSTSAADRAALTRGLLSLPSAFNEAKGLGNAETLADQRRAAWLARQATRSLDDLDPAAAMACLDMVPDSLKATDSIKRLADRRRTLAATKLRLRRRGDSLIKLDGKEPSASLELVLDAGPQVPSGTASLLIAGIDRDRMTVSPKDKEYDWNVEPVPVGGPSSEPIALTVSRSDLVDKGEVTVSLQPRAFFRGRVLDTETPVTVELARIIKEFQIEIKSTNLGEYRKVAYSRRVIEDQFKRHPERCALYNGFATAIDISVKYTPLPDSPAMRKIKARVTLDGVPIVESIAADLKEGTVTPLFKNVKIESGDLKDQGSKLSVELLDGERKLDERPVRFQAIDPQEYYVMEWGTPVVAPTGGAVFVTLKIRRRGDDPISRDALVNVRYAAGQLWNIVHSNRKVEEGSRAKPDDFSRPLLQEEQVQYTFMLPGAMELGAGGPDPLGCFVELNRNTALRVPPMVPNAPGAAPPSAPVAPAPPPAPPGN